MQDYLAQLFYRDDFLYDAVFSSLSDALFFYQEGLELHISVPCWFHGLRCWQTIARSATYQGV